MSTLYLYSISQLGGHVWHDMHLLWFTVLSRSAPVITCWRWTRSAVARKAPNTRNPHGGAPPSRRDLLLPGLHKLMRSGLAGRCRTTCATRCTGSGRSTARAAFRIDGPPLGSPAGGLFVLAFELSFPLLVLWHRRPSSPQCSALFHLFTQAIFLIPFASVWLATSCSSTFGRGCAASDARARKRRTRPRRQSTRAVVKPDDVGAASCSRAQWSRGSRSNAFVSFACYPTFEWRVGNRDARSPNHGGRRPGRGGGEVPARRAQRGPSESGQRFGAWWARPPRSSPNAFGPITSDLRAIPGEQAPRGDASFYRMTRSVLPRAGRASSARSCSRGRDRALLARPRCDGNAAREEGSAHAVFIERAASSR